MSDCRCRELKKANADLSRELRKVSHELEDRALLANRLARAVEKFPAVTAPKTTSTTKTPTTCATLALMLGDWHIGAKVVASDVCGYNRYDLKTASERLGLLETRLNSLHQMLSQTHRIGELVILGLGDMIDGLIHEEAIVYAEIEPIKQVATAGYLLGSFIQRCCTRFPSVRAECLDGDNHSRVTKRVRYARRGAWSLGHLVNVIAKLSTQDCENLTFRHYEEAKAMVEVGGLKFLMQHGNDIRGWQSIPFYGVYRALGREASARMRRSRLHKEDLRFDYMVMGHYHSPVLLPHVMMNGSLCGATPFESVGMSVYGEPSQTAFVVAGKAVTLVAPLSVDVWPNVTTSK